MQKPNKINNFHLTFDIDWAPDFCVELILNLLNKKNIKGTFFITHQSDIIKDIIKNGHHIGIHPNFLPNSSQGKTVEEILNYLLKLAPEATTIRTHALFQYTNLFLKIFTEFPQLKHDLSIFMYKFPHIKPFEWKVRQCSFMRLNYNWEDDVAFFDEQFDWITPQFYGDLTIFDFHPIHVALNSFSEKSYDALNLSHRGSPHHLLNKDKILNYQNHGHGARTYLEGLINSDATSLKFEEII